MRKRFSYLFLSLLVGLSLHLLNTETVKSATNHAVISEIQITGTTSTDEFVELYNPTTSDIVMTNWRLTRKNSSGTEANLVAALNGTVPAFGHFLIGHGTGYDGSVTLDTAYSAPSNALTNSYTVLLYSDAGVTLVDKVGFGSAVDFETAAFASNPAANGSIERVTETDNNSVDFVLRAVSDPQNSLSPVITPTPSPTVSPTNTPSSTPTDIPTSTPTNTPTQTPSPTPTEIPSPTPTEVPTTTPTATPAPTTIPTETPTSTPSSTPTSTPVSTNSPKGWLRSPVFTCSNPHIPPFVYQLLKFLMPWKFNCG